MLDFDLFYRLRSRYIPSISINKDNIVNSEVERLFNKRITKKGRGFIIKYLIRQKEYNLKFNK